MKKVSLPYYYFVWHYSIALEDILRLRATFTSFIVKYLSLKLLSRYIFSPLFRSEIHAANASIQDQLLNFGYNLMTRCMGFVARAGMIFFAFLLIALWNIACLMLLIVWILWPFVIFFIISFGIKIAVS